MSLTYALQEARASSTRGETERDTLEFNHPSFDAPVRLIAEELEDKLLPLTFGGEPVLFKALPMTVVPPGDGDDGRTPGRLRIDNTSLYLLDKFRAAAKTSFPIEVIYRPYVTTDLTRPGDVIDGLEVRKPKFTAVSMEVSLALRESGMQAYPLAIYDDPTLEEG